jgi:glucose-1-phosphate adenylyltransferase
MPIEVAPSRIVALVLAGGKGERLFPLTAERSKPAVPFGGKYRIVDFVLSSLLNSNMKAIFVLTQYKAQSLLEHLQLGWIHASNPDDFLLAVPAQMQSGESWYRGTADAIYQNLRLLDRTNPEVVAVFGADHIYKMNVHQMAGFHREVGAAATVACLPVQKEEASAFGVIGVDAGWKITGFVEKPKDPPEIPDQPGWSLVSMGNYLFNTDTLVEALKEDAEDRDSVHDFGKSILPKMIHHQPVYAYDFKRNRIPMKAGSEPEAAYWRDIGTIQSYFEANLDLKNVQPHLNLYNWDWPIRSVSFNDPPAKFVFDEDARRGQAVQSVVSAGCIITGGYVKDSVLARNVFVDEGAEVVESVIHDNARIGRGARVRRVIIDKNNHIEPGETVGYDLEEDKKKYHVSPNGIVVVRRAKDTPESRARNL